MNYTVLDSETDELLDKATKIHCLCAKVFKERREPELVSFTDYDEMKEFLLNQECIIGHNIIRFDLPIFKKILGIDLITDTKIRFIDTLGLSWYLHPQRLTHNLNDWGTDLGIIKPTIEDWVTLDVQEYIHRCTEDVKINSKLFHLQIKYLIKIYEQSEKIRRITNYLTFKLICAAEQEQLRWRLDVPKAESNLEELKQIWQAKKDELESNMPPNFKYKIVSPPKAGLLKKDQTLSVAGEKWLELCKELDLPYSIEHYHMSPVKTIAKVEKGNPGSFSQMKAWLFSKGWKPQTYKYVREKKHDYTSPEKAIPQISLADGSDLCSSVKELYEIEPKFKALEGFYIAKHRIGILTNFLKDGKEKGYLEARINGFTNTLRFQHVNPLTNLPTVHRLYGSYIRGVLIAPSDNHILCGADMSSLEDSTKQHYMYKYDPKYVEEMQKPGFDPHLDIALQGKMVTNDDIIFYKKYNKKLEETNDEYKGTEEEVKRYKAIKKIRGNEGKKTNFSAVYGVGKRKMALTNNWHEDKADRLLIVYWKRNWAVKKVAANCKVKTVNGQMWLFNPVSKFWYSLRADKDRFSTLNQGTGVYCFDTWVGFVRENGIKLCGQFHDEIIFPLKKINIERVKPVLDEAIDKTNQKLKLNVILRISKNFGSNYGQIH